MNSNVLAIIEGLSGSGKTFTLTSLKKMNKNLIVKDLDDFTQSAFISHDNYKDSINEIKNNINNWMNTQDKNKYIIFGGIHTIVVKIKNEYKFIPILDLDKLKNCLLIYLDITPKKIHLNTRCSKKKINRKVSLPKFKKCVFNDNFWNLYRIPKLTKNKKDRSPNKYLGVFANIEMLEATRRAVLREFKKDSLKEWINFTKYDLDSWNRYKSMESPYPKRGSETRKKLKVPSFYHLKPPRKIKNGISRKLFSRYMNMDLKKFIKIFKPYFDNMFEDLYWDKMDRNRDIILNLYKAIPLKYETILKIFDQKITINNVNNLIWTQKKSTNTYLNKKKKFIIWLSKINKLKLK